MHHPSKALITLSNCCHKFSNPVKTIFNTKSVTKLTNIRSLNFHSLIDVSSEVKLNLNNKSKPVVALESTIITHGLPFPRNVEVAVEVEEIVRSQGAIPATVGIVDGRVKVGLNREELSRLATPAPACSNNTIKNPIKTSRRDLPFVIEKGLCGGTTVSGTIVICNMVGIKIFVTGGIGGVHRDGQNTMDVSADLVELSRHPITVISSGVKSILDIQRTLEYLETFGVCVVTYGETDDFPAFYTRKSGCRSPYNVTSIEEAASLVSTLNKLNLNSGLLLAVPVPSEYCTLDYGSIEKVISGALIEAELENVKGKQVTPFLLDKINKMSDGQLLETNVGLIKNNALIGSKVAVQLNKNVNEQELQKICKSSKNDIKFQPAGVDFSGISNLGTNIIDTSYIHQQKFYSHQTISDVESFSTSVSRSPVVIGGSNLDCIVSPQEELKYCGGMLSGKMRMTGGGVGRNFAEALAKFGARPRFLSVIGEDLPGRFITQYTQPFVDFSDVLVRIDHPTASCIVLLDPIGRENILLIGDMSIHTNISNQYLADKLDIVKNGSVVLFDGNLPIHAMQMLLKFCGENDIPVWFEPTDVKTSHKPFLNELWKKLTFISPNLSELRCIHSAVTGGDPTNANAGKSPHDDNNNIDALLKEAIHLSTPLSKHIDTIMITLGHHGVLIVGKENENLDTNYSMMTLSRGSDMDGHDNSNGISSKVSARYYARLDINPKEIASVSGAGDCCVAGYMKGVLSGLNEPECIQIGLSAALDSLRSVNTVPDQFSATVGKMKASEPKLIVNLES